MKKAILIVVSLIFVQCTYGQDVTEADRFFMNQDFKKALAGYKTCFDADTLNIYCLSRAAKSAKQLGDSQLAKSLFLKLIDRDTILSDSYINLSALYEEEQNYAKAIKYYSKLHVMYEDRGLYARKLGRLYQVTGIYKDAFGYYTKANKLNPRDMKSIKGLAEIFMGNHQEIEADSILREGILIDSSHVGINLLLAKLSYKQKEYQITVNRLESLTGRVDFDSYYDKLYGYALMQIDSTDKAIYYLNRALVKEPKDEKTHYYLGVAYDKLEDIESAIFHHSKAAEYSISPSIDRYYRNLGRLYDETKDLPNAIKAYKEAIRYGGDRVIYYYLARACDIYYADKKIAIQYYDKYLKSDDKKASYRRYAKDRKVYLKEHLHQKM